MALPACMRAGRAAQVDKLVLGVAQGPLRSQLRLLAKLGFTLLSKMTRLSAYPVRFRPCLSAIIRSTLTSMMRAASLHRCQRPTRTIDGSAFSLK
jgi:hypothetical protein